MAELITLARPYAKAAFEYALARKELQVWSDMLALAAAVARMDNMVKVMASPGLSSLQKGEEFTRVCGDQLTEKGQNFIKSLAANHRLQLLPEIQQLFEAYKSQQEKSIEVEVSTAFELSPELQTKLAKSLSARLNREVNMRSSVDKSLLGGAIIRTGDTVIDGSVRGRLAKLAEAMNS